MRVEKVMKIKAKEIKEKSKRSQMKIVYGKIKEMASYGYRKAIIADCEICNKFEKESRKESIEKVKEQLFKDGYNCEISYSERWGNYLLKINW